MGGSVSILFVEALSPRLVPEGWRHGVPMLAVPSCLLLHQLGAHQGHAPPCSPCSDGSGSSLVRGGGGSWGTGPTRGSSSGCQSPSPTTCCEHGGDEAGRGGAGRGRTGRGGAKSGPRFRPAFKSGALRSNATSSLFLHSLSHIDSSFLLFSCLFFKSSICPFVSCPRQQANTIRSLAYSSSSKYQSLCM